MTIRVCIESDHAAYVDTDISETALRAVRYRPMPTPAANAVQLLAAALITCLEQLRASGQGGAPRQASHAITMAEDASMWGVKAATEGL